MMLLDHAAARFEYEILQQYEAGLMLSGAEVKSLRGKHGSLSGSFVKIMGGEAFLINAQISPYKYADNTDYDPKRTRKLLLKRRELANLETASQQKGLTLVPLAIIATGPYLKLRFGLGRGKKLYEKRAKLRERDLQRESDRELKSLR